MIRTCGFILLLCLSANCYSQNVWKPAIGFNNTILIDKAENRSISGAGIGFEAGSTFQLGRQVYFEIGAFFRKQSVQGKSSIGFPGFWSPGSSCSSSYSGILIPVQLGVRLLSYEQPVNLRLFGGVAPMLIVSQTECAEVTNGNAELRFGGAIDLFNFFIEPAFSYGIAQIQDKNENSRARIFQLHVGYQLNL